MTDTTTTSATDYQLHAVCLAATTGLGGAPTLYLSLAVDPSRGTETGQGRQVQAIAPPAGDLHINGITGRAITEYVLGAPEQMLILHGTVVVNFPPPAIGSMAEPFSAVLHFTDAEHGVASWTLAGQSYRDVPFTAHPC